MYSRLFFSIPPLSSASQGFLNALEGHLLARIMGDELGQSESSPLECRHLKIKDNLLFSHKVLRINYTTYDMRRGQDSLNPRNHCDFMALAPPSSAGSASAHPFVYGRILGIFHAYVRYARPESRPQDGYRQVDFLWVRWFRLDDTFGAGWDSRRHHRLEFLPSSTPDAFGFMDPADVLRSVHAIPAFACGRTSKLLPYRHSIGRQPRELDERHKEWKYYFVNTYLSLRFTLPTILIPC